MILGAEIGLLLLGLYGLFAGKMVLSKQRVVYGAPARLLGVIACMPIPLSYAATLAFMRTRLPNSTSGSPGWSLIALEGGILVACVTLLYVIGFMVSDASRAYGGNSYPDPIDSPPTPPKSDGKAILLTCFIGIAVFVAGLLVFLAWPQIQARLGFTTPLNETADSDIEAMPPAPAVAGPVPECLMPASWQPRVDRMLKFNRRTMGDAYDKVGKKNPQWDEHALNAMELTARHFSNRTDREAQPKDIHAATQKALDAGCDDPLVLYLHYRFPDKTLTGAELDQGLAKAAKAVKASAYPPFRRASAISKAMEQAMTREDRTGARAEVARQVSALLWLITVSAREEKPCHDLEWVWYDLAKDAFAAHKWLSGDSHQAWQRVNDLLVTAKPLEATQLLFKGEHHIQWAWEARGNGYANTVPKDNWRHFEWRLSIAREALEQSWELSPGRPAKFMLTVEMGQSRGRAEMEKWFERAIEYHASIEVCGAKLEWLHAKWHGSTEEMLTFGRECRDSGNWARSYPLIIVEVHQRIADMQLSETAKSNYFRQPEVAADIVYVYAKAVECYPDDPALRSRYAYYSYHCGHPRRAHRQFELLGNKLAWDDRFTEKMLKEARAKAAKPVAGLATQ